MLFDTETFHATREKVHLPMVAPVLRTEPDISFYDKFVVAFSGGKDSLACVLHLLELGVPKDRIELWHHEIDGREGSNLMDWASTPAYCRKVAKELGISYFSSWKEGGFEREMLRDNQPTAPTHFETPGGAVLTAGGVSGKLGTRLKFPQTSADLSVRWCSAYLKIDVFCIALRNQSRFAGLKTLVLSGERAQESSCRAKYKPFESHRTDARDGKSQRHVDAWRPVHQWSEADVWAIIQRFKIAPHCGYRLGFGRLSCARCIFGSPNQWASARVVCPSAVAKIASYEKQFGITIDRKLDVQAKADKGTPYPATANQALIDEANDPNWDGPVFVDDWQMPAGAFGENTGPT